MFRYFIRILILLCVLYGSALAGTIEPKGDGTYGVVLNVGFLYEENDIEEWHPIFNLASSMLWKASGSRVFLQKVTFYNDCPEIRASSSDELTKKLKSRSSDFDVLVYRNGTTAVADERSYTIGRGTSAGPVVLFESHALGEGQKETLGHELAHLIFGIADEYGQQGGGGKVTFYDATKRSPSDIFTELQNSSEEGIVRLLNQNVLEPRIASNEVTRRGAWVFCSDHSFESPNSCIMDGDGLDYYDRLCGSEDHVRATVIRNLASSKVGETSVLAKNGQHIKFRTSCQNTAANIFQNRWGFDVDFSTVRWTPSVGQKNSSL